MCRARVCRARACRARACHARVDPPGARARAQAPIAAGPSAALNAERKALNQQLLAFTRVIGDLSQLESDGGARLLGARDSRLTQVLAPLLAGSCRTYLLACIRPEPTHFLD
eukprot:6280293-Prymnesium_polylepis.1